MFQFQDGGANLNDFRTPFTRPPGLVPGNARYMPPTSTPTPAAKPSPAMQIERTAPEMVTDRAPTPNVPAPRFPAIWDRRYGPIMNQIPGTAAEMKTVSAPYRVGAPPLAMPMDVADKVRQIQQVADGITSDMKTGATSPSTQAVIDAAKPAALEAGFFSTDALKNPTFWIGTAAFVGLITYLAKTNGSPRRRRGSHSSRRK